MHEKNKDLATNTMLLAVGTICSKSLSLLFIPLFSHWLTVKQYGNFDLYATYVSLLAPVMSFSVGEALFRYIIDETVEEKKKNIITNSLFICIIGMIFISILLGLFLYNFSKKLLIPFMFYLIFYVLNEFTIFYLRGVRKLNIYAFTGLYNVLITFCSVFFLVKKCKLGTEGMLFGYGIASALTTLTIWIKVNIWKDVNFNLLDKSIIYKLVRYSIPMVPNALSWWIVNVSDRTIIKLFLGSTFNGLYALANKIPALCTTLFSVFHISWQETIVLCINNDDRDDYINKIFNQVCQIMISICIPILSLNYLMFLYIFDTTYFKATYQVPILLFSVIVNVMSLFIGGIFVALKDTKATGLTTIISALSNIFINLLLVNYLGLFSASISTLSSFLLLFFCRYLVLKKKYHIDITIKYRTWILVIVFILFAWIDFLHILKLNIILFFIGNIIFVVVNKENILKLIKKYLNAYGIFK